VAMHSVMHPVHLHTAHSVAIGGVLGVFCGVISTLSPILSQTPSSTLI